MSDKIRDNNIPHIPTDEEIEEERRKLKVKSQYKGDDKKPTNEAIQNDEDIGEILQKYKIAMATIVEKQKENDALRADLKEQKEECKELKQIIKENSFVKAGDVDTRLVLLQEDNRKLHQLYTIFNTPVVTHQKIESVVVDPLNRKAWIKDMTQDDADRTIIRLYRETQERVKIEVAEAGEALE